MSKKQKDIIEALNITIFEYQQKHSKKTGGMRVFYNPMFDSRYEDKEFIEMLIEFANKNFSVKKKQEGGTIERAARTTKDNRK